MFKWFYFVVALLSLELSWASPKTPKTYDNLPKEVRRVMQYDATIERIDLRSSLSGTTEGSLDLSINMIHSMGFYSYQDNFRFEVLDPAWELQVLESPPTQSFLDPVSKTLKQGYFGDARFLVRLSAQQTLPAPPELGSPLPVSVRFQSCSKEICLLPVWLNLAIPFQTTDGKTDVANAKLVDANPGERGGSASKSSQSAWLILGAGILTAFTPCVYPLYPVTLGMFSSWIAAAHVPLIVLALTYTLGLVLSYAAIGMFAALTGALFGISTQSVGFYVFLGVVFLLSTLSFGGWISFWIPDWLRNFFSRPITASQVKSPGKALAQAFLMGVGLGVVASPCVGPVLIAILTWLGQAVSQDQSAIWQGFFQLSIFGVGMAIPFLGIGLMMDVFHKKLRLGGLSAYAKQIGTALLAVSSIYFFSEAWNRYQFQNSGLALKQPLPFEVRSLEQMEPTQMAVIDFKADWCVACYELDTKTFRDPAVVTLLKENQIQFVSVDLTLENDQNRAIQERFQIVGLPTVLFYNAQGQRCQNLDLFGFEGPDLFAERLRKISTACK